MKKNIVLSVLFFLPILCCFANSKVLVSIPEYLHITNAVRKVDKDAETEIVFPDDKGDCKIYNFSNLVLRKNYSNEFSERILIHDYNYTASIPLVKNMKNGRHFIVIRNIFKVNEKLTDISAIPDTLFANGLYRNDKPFEGDFYEIIEYMQFRFIRKHKYSNGKKVFDENAQGKTYEVYLSIAAADNLMLDPQKHNDVIKSYIKNAMLTINGVIFINQYEKLQKINNKIN